MWQIAGLPAHPLLVHAVVVLIPLAALMVIVGSVWPAARRKLGVLTPLVAAVALVFVPLAKEAGEALERQVPGSAALEVHTELGDQLFPWAIGLFVVAAGQWVWFRMRARKPSGDTRSTAARVSTIAIAVVAIGVSVGTTVSVVQVGDSGARAIWSGQSGTSSTEK